MKEATSKVNRRDFMIGSAAWATAVGAVSGMQAGAQSVITSESAEEFSIYQQRRRWELWDLLGELPWDHKPAPPRLVRTEKHDGYTLERLVLDLNGVEPVPALLLIPDRRQERAPGLLFIHWHGNQYDLGKEELLLGGHWHGGTYQPAYAPVCAEKGLVTLAVDSWCFGERKHEPNGLQGEADMFKLMLWQGRVLWGMMMFDEFRALTYLASRPEVDASRLGATGMSMGSTKTWWLAALDPRVRLAIDVCCLTDYESLIKAQGLNHHGIYYFVPSLLKHFDTFQINELIVPRPRLSVNGRQDTMTPPSGVENVRDKLLPLYRTYGRSEDCKIELFDCGHIELPEMRTQILAWMDKYLVAPVS
jgi:dienelactone hydrolase